jgi:hypothetical protein
MTIHHAPLWGFIIGDGESILGFIPINTEDNVLHLVIGLAGLAAGSVAHPAPAGPVRGGPAPRTDAVARRRPLGGEPPSERPSARRAGQIEGERARDVGAPGEDADPRVELGPTLEHTAIEAQ